MPRSMPSVRDVEGGEYNLITVADCLVVLREALQGCRMFQRCLSVKIAGLYFRAVLMNLRDILGFWKLMRKVETAAAYHQKFQKVGIKN